MATVTPRPQVRRSLDESHRRVRHPLQKLRGYIRFYVSVEGVTLLLSMLAVWFWASLLLDYESFALFHLDWAQSMPAYVRSLMLGTVFAASAALVTAGIFLPLGRLLGLVAAAIGALMGLGLGWWIGGLVMAVFVALFGALVVGGLVMTVVAAVTLLTRGWWYGAVGLPLLFFYLADWFGLGLLVSYGWLGPWATGLAMIAVLLLGPVVAVELKRMLVDFRDSALALVLERRYPKQLGDRLITAVELANLREAARWGYSPAMIEQTIHDAADRVEPLPVQQVFDWQRLVFQGIGVVALTVGIYALVAAGFCAVESARRQEVSLAGMGRLHDTMGIWFERNVLLENTPWPRRAHLELVGFPASGEIRMPENTQPPVIVVRAYKWVIADRRSEFGWRPLRWGDLTPELLDAPVPADAVPNEWGWPAESAAALTLDDIELRLDQAASHTTLQPESQKALRDLFEQLQVQAARPAMSRKLRMLAIPEKVKAFYWGRDTRGDVDPNREPGNLFKVSFPVLKEPVDFRVKGDDFYTPKKHIETVAPPRLTDLYRDEYRPAYLHYRLPRGDDPVRVLKGKKQLKENIGVTLHGSETSRFDVAIGTDVVLFGKSDKPLQSVVVKRRDASMPFEAKAELVNPDAAGHSPTFQVRFDNVRPSKDRVPGKPAVYDFDVAFTDTDNVTSSRNVVIRPVEDSPPTASLEITVVRKSPKGPYLITPRAYVPFQGKMSDEQGLDRINYHYTLALEEKEAEQGGKTLLFLSGLGLMVGGPPHEVLVAAALASLTSDRSKADSSGDVRQLPVTSFEAELARLKQDFLPLPEILRRLGETSEQTVARIKELRPTVELSQIREWVRDQPPLRPLPKSYELRAEDGYTPFDLDDLPKRGDDRLKVSQTPGVQQRYQMQVWVEALDNDIETGPNRGRSKDTFSFLVVSEEELRLEIAREEEDLRIRMQEVKELLRGPGSCEDKLLRLMSDLGDARLRPDGFGPAIARANELRKVVEDCLSKSVSVQRDYQRILRELQVNRVQPSKIDQVEKKIIEPLGRIIRGDKVKVAGRTEEREVGFPPAAQALARLGQRMSASMEEASKMSGSDAAKMLAQAREDAGAAREHVKELADAIEALLKDMEDIIGFDEVLKRAIRLLEGVTNQEMALGRWEKWLKEKIIKDLLEGPEKKP